MTAIGRFRVYFNRHGAAPLVWCISPEDGAWEIAVRSVTINTICEAVYKPLDRNEADDGKPSAWMSAEGQLTVIEGFGHASIGTP